MDVVMINFVTFRAGLTGLRVYHLEVDKKDHKECDGRDHSRVYIYSPPCAARQIP